MPINERTNRPRTAICILVPAPDADLSPRPEEALDDPRGVIGAYLHAAARYGRTATWLPVPRNAPGMLQSRGQVSGAPIIARPPRKSLDRLSHGF